MGRKRKTALLVGGVVAVLFSICFGVLFGTYSGADGVLTGVLAGVGSGLIFGGLTLLFARLQEKRYAPVRAQLEEQYGVIADGRCSMGLDGALLSGWLFVCENRLVFRCLGVDGVDETRTFSYRGIKKVESRPFLGLFHTRFCLFTHQGETVFFRSMDGALFMAEIQNRVDKSIIQG